MVGPKFDTTVTGKRETDHIPPLKDGDIRIIHLGGVEEIGRNMSLVEYKDTILIVDCGVQFTETSTPGIDFILPNTRYLEEHKHKIKGVLVTHGHLDHIGSIPYIMPRIGNPQIYARLFTSLMIKKRQEEFPHLSPLTINIVEKGDAVTLGDLKVRFFGVTHAIPDSMGIMIETPYGDIVHTGDLRLEHNDGVPTDDEIERYKVFEERKTLLLMADSTNCENPGFSISDTVVYKNIENIIRETPGRLIISTFASQVERMLFMLETAERYGKKVVVEGRSMKTNVEIAKLADMLKIKPETLIPLEDLTRYPENKLIILATGQQGEEFAALGRIASKTHKFIRLTPRDTILMSSSVVPGNERAVQNLKDKLSLPTSRYPVLIKNCWSNRTSLLRSPTYRGFLNTVTYTTAPLPVPVLPVDPPTAPMAPLPRESDTLPPAPALLTVPEEDPPLLTEPPPLLPEDPFTGTVTEVVVMSEKSPVSLTEKIP
jgi:ribonuclease J